MPASIGLNGALGDVELSMFTQIRTDPKLPSAPSTTIYHLDQTDVIDGGMTIDYVIVSTDLTHAWPAAGAAFEAIRQDIIDGMDASTSPATGWNNEVRDKEVVGAVTRVDDTTLRVTLTAAAAYSITDDELVAVTVPGTAIDNLDSDVFPTVESFALFEPSENFTEDTNWRIESLVVDLSGTVTTADEQHIRSGGRTILLDVFGDTWVSGASFDNARQAILDGLDSGGVETLGWNNEVRDAQPVTAVVRTSSTRVTITLTTDSANYDITETETITATIPITALNGAPEDTVTAAPTFTIDLFELSCALSGTVVTAPPTEQDIRDGGKTIILTLTGDDTFDAEPNWSFGPARQQILDNLDSAQAEATGWDAEVRDKESVSAVARTSNTVVTITLSAAAAYDITANETITSIIPAIALERSTLACDVTPTFAVTTLDVSTTSVDLQLFVRRNIGRIGKH